MVINKSLYSSVTNDWRTPSELFLKLHAEFNFTMDVAADDNNHLVDDYYTETNSALMGYNPWVGNIWCNPPYGKIQKDFISEAALRTRLKPRPETNLVVLLIPARTDTKTWQEFIFPHATQIRFLKGRLKFLDAQGNMCNAAPFPSAVVVFTNSLGSTLVPQIGGWDWKTTNKFI